MKIAVTYEDGNIYQHFGHTSQFKLYEIDDEKIISSEVVSTGDKGHGALAGLLGSFGANALICGGIGGGAQQALASAGIQLYGGCEGDADEAVKAFIKGELGYNADVSCDHHDHHDENHSCGNHTCH